MKPSVGRIVHHRSHQGAEVEAAIITSVVTDEIVRLRVFGANGDYEYQSQAKFWDYKPGEAPPTLGGCEGYWSWPPRLIE